MKLGHVHLKVSNLERAEEFYVNILGFKVSESVGEEYLFLTLGEMHHDLALRNMGEDAPHPPKNYTGLYHFALEVENEKELFKIAKKLEKNKIAFSTADHGISKSLYFKDPDENGVEVYVDTRYVRKDWNGITTKFDVESLVNGKI